jgi:hypothetical protein
MSHPHDPNWAVGNNANDNVRKRSTRNRPPEVEVRLPKGLPVQLVEVEVLAELLESLPPISNDNSGENGE